MNWQLVQGLLVSTCVLCSILQCFPLLVLADGAAVLMLMGMVCLPFICDLSRSALYSLLSVSFLYLLSRLGLAAYACTSSLPRTFRMLEGLEAGLVGINEGGISSEVAPFGGFKESGLGREGGHEGLDCFTETKYVNININ